VSLRGVFWGAGWRGGGPGLSLALPAGFSRTPGGMVSVISVISPEGLIVISVISVFGLNVISVISELGGKVISVISKSAVFGLVLISVISI
jgi:hypothetical protein